MEVRCPGAKPIGTAILKGWKLVFGYTSKSFNAVATIEPDKNYEVPVLLWEISEENEASLDRYEGYPFKYDKKDLEIEFEGRQMKVFAYIMNPIYNCGKPSEHYYNTIKQGYMEVGLDVSYLDKAVEESAWEDNPNS